MSLFSEFNRPSKSDWTQQVKADTKTENLDAILNWKFDASTPFEIFYNHENLDFQTIKSVQQPQNQAINRTWQNRIKIITAKNVLTNSLIISTLHNGADSVILEFSDALDWYSEIKELLRQIKLTDNAFFFKVENNSLELVNALQKLFPYHIKGGIINDLIARWMMTGILDKKEWETQKDILGKMQESKNFKSLIIGSHHFHNSGANSTQEVAFLLNSVVENIDKLSDLGVSIQDIIQKIEVSISIGTGYFEEIAKVRALRFLLSKLLSCYGNEYADFHIPIHCQTSEYFSSNIAQNTNMLRATTEAMSAIIGGCDALTVLPFDRNDTTGFSERIARNVSTILKEEAYFDKVVDPSAGSYYLENLTVIIINQSWALFQKVENQGGVMKAFENGFIQNEIKKERDYRVKKLQNTESVMVGVNKYRHDEKPFIQKNDSIIQQSSVPFELLKNERISLAFEISN
jgi:methylmalonyl-CoA mutase